MLWAFQEVFVTEDEPESAIKEGKVSDTPGIEKLRQDRMLNFARDYCPADKTRGLILLVLLVPSFLPRKKEA